MKRVLAALGVILTAGITVPAFAGSPPAPQMPIGGRTIAGPGTTSLVASEEETIASGISGNSVCATVANTGNAAVQLTITGDGSGQLSIPTRKTLTLCRENALAVSLLCQAVGGGTCRAVWRVDDF